MDLGFIYINTTFILEVINKFLAQSPLEIVLQVFIIAGWLPLAYIFLKTAVGIFHDYRIEKFTHNWKFVLLAIDIPQINVQTPKAVEQMFAHLAGAFNKPDLKDKLFGGYEQRWFSLEIISIEGYIQFLVWTEETFRDLLEGAVYAQYPEAEVVAVEDYVYMVPDKFPNDTHDIWAADFGLAEHSAFPIRTYEEFEHNISKDTVLKDPMGTFLESFSRIGRGEQMWFQILVEPIDNSWKEDAIAKIKEVIGEESGHSGGGFFNLLGGEFSTWFSELKTQIFGSFFTPSEGGGESEHVDKNQLKFMTPGQIKSVEAMEDKISKLGFKTRMRGIYIARKEVYNPVRGVNALVGAINQYNIPTANSLVIADSPANDKQKTKFLSAYKSRKLKLKADTFILNIEELATVWHFPMSHVKTPLVQKASSKQSEPPAGLPVEKLFDSPEEIAETVAKEKGKKKFITDSGDVVEYSDIY